MTFRPFANEMLSLEKVLALPRHPDKEQLLRVLRGEKPERPVLFEFYLNDNIYRDVTRDMHYDPQDPYARQKMIIDAYYRLGYDYVNLYGGRMRFPVKQVDKHGAASVSQNAQAVIADREDFEKYPWPDPDAVNYERMDVIGSYLPEGMGYTVYGPGGMEETLIELVGYEPLCYMLVDEPELVSDILDRIGHCLLRYYEICAAHPCVDALIYNDDWGYNQQTLLPPSTLRTMIFPWVRRIVEAIKAQGKPVILHSCGNVGAVMEDIITDLRFDAKHSYQDIIVPVEQFYQQYHRRIAVMGGVDVDYIIRSAPKDIYDRACGLLEMSAADGAYALGSGNSIPEYVPTEQYLAMLAAVRWNQ